MFRGAQFVIGNMIPDKEEEQTVGIAEPKGFRSTFIISQKLGVLSLQGDDYYDYHYKYYHYYPDDHW